MSSEMDFPGGAIVVPVGSRVTCDPAPTDTDEDYLVLVKDKHSAVMGLKSIGFTYSGDPEQMKQYEEMNETSAWAFTSMYFGSINYIITDSHFFFERFLTATYICKRLNLLKKEDRIAVFEAVRGASFSKEMVPGWEPDLETLFKLTKTGAVVREGTEASMVDNLLRCTGTPYF